MSRPPKPKSNTMKNNSPLLTPLAAERLAVGSIALFDMSSVEKLSPRLEQIRKHDIQTHHAAHCEEPWLAIPMKMARESLKGYEPHDGPLTSPAAITASYGRLLDESGMTFFGKSEREVQDAALQFVNLSND